MKNITSEQIDEIINETFIELNENVLNDFVDNYEGYKGICETILKDMKNVPSYDAKCFTYKFSELFAIFKMAQDNCIEVFRKTLKELLCDE